MSGLRDPSVIIEESETQLRQLILKAGDEGSLPPDAVGAALMNVDRLARTAEELKRDNDRQKAGTP